MNGGLHVFFVMLMSSPYWISSATSNSQCSAEDGCSFKRVLLTGCINSDSQLLKTISTTTSFFDVDIRLLSDSNENAVSLSQANVVKEVPYHCSNKNNALPLVDMFKLIKDVLLEFEADLILELTLIFGTTTGTVTQSEVQLLIQDIAELCDAGRHVFHIFVDPSVDGHLFGVNSQVKYKDGSHFNKALTLRNLLADKKTASNLQAHLLSIGVFTTVNHANHLGSFVYPSFSEVFGYQYKDLCHSIDCPSGTFCSPLHGCIEPASSRPFLKQKNKEINLSEEQFIVQHGSSSAGPTTEDAIKDINLSIIDNDHEVSDTHQLQPNGRVKVLNWTTDKPFIKQVVRGAKPVLLKHTVVNSWSAISDPWTIKSVCTKLDTNTLNNVKCSNTFVTFDPDHRAALKLNLSVPYDIKNISKDYFCSCVESNSFNGSQCDYEGYYYFNSVPEVLKDDLKPNDFLFIEKEDKEKEKQFIWISSKGMITHGHFDQDYNIFVQIEGRKKFTLWSPWQHELMYMFPRVHPLWHKSRINFQNPDLLKFSQFALAKGQEIIVEPGDILYVPPYTWHYVETLSPSISLSTWSHDNHMYDHMNAIYGYDHKFDLMVNSTG